MPRIALIVDNPLRDLPGIALVAARLAASGSIAHLVPLARQSVEVRALAPDGVLLNYLRPSNARFAHDLVEAGISVSVLDTEGGVLPNLDVYDRALLNDPHVRREIAAFFCWGRTLSRHLITTDAFREDQIVLTGSPRFDFYAPRWREAALAASAYADDCDQPMVLVNGNFSMSNPLFQTPERELQMLVETFGEDRQQAEAYQQRDRAALSGLVDAVRRLAEEHPLVTFVYRPHPFERLDTYKASFDGYRNIALERRGAVDGWILRARAVIQRSCTTAIEAGMAGVPALSPGWIETPMAMPSADAASITCPTFESMSQTVAEAVRGELVIPEAVTSSLRTTQDDWFGSIDGASADRVAASLLERVIVTDPAARRQRSTMIGRPSSEVTRAARVTATASAMARTVLPPEVARLRRGRTGRVWVRSAKDFDLFTVSRLVEAFGASEPEVGPRSIEVEPTSKRDHVRRMLFSRGITLRPRTA